MVDIRRRDRPRLHRRRESSFTGRQPPIPWEIPFMPARFVWFRAAVSVPFSVPGGGDRDGDREAVKAPKVDSGNVII
jgi:hypothetical protein